VVGVLINDATETVWDTANEFAFVHAIFCGDDTSETTGITVLDLTLILGISYYNCSNLQVFKHHKLSINQTGNLKITNILLVSFHFIRVYVKRNFVFAEYFLQGQFVSRCFSSHWDYIEILLSLFELVRVVGSLNEWVSYTNEQTILVGECFTFEKVVVPGTFDNLVFLS